MLRKLAAIFAFLLGIVPVSAMDGAAFNAIGYSPDSRYFAFQQYGIRDGSGFPYWDIFVIDLKADEWVKDTPIHVVLEEENAPIADARAKAAEAALPILKQLDVSTPAEVLAANPATEVVTDRNRITFDRWYIAGGSRPDSTGGDVIRHDLAVEAVERPPPKVCYPDDGPYYGFRLTIKDRAMNSSRVIHLDEAIPESRGCPLSYDLAAVVAPAGYPVTDRLVAIVGVYTKGFEGPDHRFIAVPFTISD